MKVGQEALGAYIGGLGPLVRGQVGQDQDQGAEGQGCQGQGKEAQHQITKTKDNEYKETEEKRRRHVLSLQVCLEEMMFI